MDKKDHDRDNTKQDNSHYIIIFVLLIIVILIIYSGIYAKSFATGGILTSRKGGSKFASSGLSLLRSGGFVPKKKVRFNMRGTGHRYFEKKDPPAKLQEYSGKYRRLRYK